VLQNLVSLDRQGRLKIATVRKYRNPLSGALCGEEMEEFEEEGRTHETGTFIFHKMTANDWRLYISKRGELANKIAEPVRLLHNTIVAGLNNRIQNECLASKYQWIRHEDYVRAELDHIRLAVDACKSITE
jgi:hypothetical protein